MGGIVCGGAGLDRKIAIQIDNPAGLDRDWPVTCGVPFPRGMIASTDGLRVEDARGRAVPCQFEITATWLADQSIRWLLLNFNASPAGEYFLAPGVPPAADKARPGITVQAAGGRLVIDTGAARFAVLDGEALVAETEVLGAVPVKIMHNSGRGAYVVDQQGRRARLGGPLSEMQSSFKVRGPQWTVLRREGWYVADDGQRIARGIVWLHFFGGSPFVKLVHRLVLTEDTNRIWFKDIGIEFQTAFAGDQAVFDTAAAGGTPAAVPLRAGEEAWMLQDDYPHFLSTNAHFSLARRSGGTEREMLAGTVCGNWCGLAGAAGGLHVTLRDFARQFPKEFTVTPAGIAVHLWAGRCGRELDFRAPTLVKEYWGEWCKNAAITPEQISAIHSDAAASAKTHTLWLLPFAGATDAAARAQSAATAARRVLAVPDPQWTCGAGVLGAPMLPKDARRFPREEAYISDFFDRIIYGEVVFPQTGYIAYGRCPNVTGPGWFRCNGLIDYHLRRNVWSLYARSGERKYFEYGERFNRFAGDMVMHHWDTAGQAGLSDASQWPEFKAVTRKVKGGFASSVISRDVDLQGRPFDDLPFYWGWGSGKVSGGSGVDMVNHLYHFYFSGDWETLELAEMHAAALKKYDFLQTPAPHRGVVELRYITALYSMDWDPALGEMARSLAHQFVDLDSPCGIYEEMSPSPLYKTGRNLVTLYDYYRLTGDELAKKGMEQIIEYKFRFLQQSPPFEYQSTVGWENVVAYWLTGDEKYLKIAFLSNRMAMRDFQSTLAEDLALPPAARANKMIRYASHFNYHACLSTPVILKALAETAAPTSAPFPVLRKYHDAPTNAWVVVRKEPNRAVRIEGVFQVAQSDELKLNVLGPDLQPAPFNLPASQQGIPDPFAYGLKTFYARIELPAGLPAGDYRLGLDNPGGPAGYAISHTDAAQVVMECPDGFWLGKAGLEAPGAFYFAVDASLAEVKLFAGSPVRITDAGGQPVADQTGKTCGELNLPAAGRHPGPWKIEADFPVLVKFINLPPYVAYLTPAALFAPAKAMPASAVPAAIPAVNAVAEPPFAPGRFGQGLALSGRVDYAFPRGAGSLDAGYENFPGRAGTIEFFYRPDWDALELIVPQSRRYSHLILDAGDLSAVYMYGQAPYEDYPQNALVFYCGKTVKFEKSPGRYKHFGNQARIYPRRHQWLHIALAWDVSITAPENLATKYKRENYQRGASSETFWVYVNGKQHQRAQLNQGWPIYLHLGKEFALDYDLTQVAEQIKLCGAAQGVIDELRISDGLRYTGDFTPPSAPLAPDRNTRALFHFDGALAGGNGLNQPIQLERCNQ